ncbi:hypothetical protein B9Z07_18330 [Burkholderia cenocepacia]|uniref:Response regulatory domain-containing protein n=1 Tax=Burkholderia cenocepacia TaxID=95486 RepID=A0AAD0J2H7_9BURK|nr:hypothetical protein B9Z07_18330 [Burkholderia cenocepacia]PRE37451.1 response regulator [Burkholderia cenocepacia]
MVTTILLVDDDEDSLRPFQLLLEREDYRVILARSGTEALAQISQHAVALMITDWSMPGMDGVTLCRTLRAHPVHHWVPIVFLSSAKAPTEQGLWNVSFLKPVSWPAVAQAVRSLLEAPRP